MNGHVSSTGVPGRRRWIKLLFLNTGLLAAAISIGLSFFSSGAEEDEAKYLVEIAPGSVFGEKSGQPPHYMSKSGIVAFNSFDVVPGIRGYAGPIKTMLSIDSRGTIVGIKILKHHETRNYVHTMETPEYLGQFLGKTVFAPIEADRDIDVISRATVSVNALADTVRLSSRKVAKEVLGLSPPETGGPGASWAGFLAYVALLCFSLFLFLHSKKSPSLLWTRDLSLLLSIAVIGVWLASPLSFLHLANMVLLRLPSSLIWVVAVPAVILSMALFGRYYCGWLCPFGAIAEFIGRIPTRKWTVPAKRDGSWRRLKYLFLWAAVMLVAFTRSPDTGDFEPYIPLFSRSGHLLSWLLVAFMLAANLKIKRFWCRYFCPIAAFGGLLSRNEKGYPSYAGCPIKNPPGPEGSECIRCNKCRFGPQSNESRLMDNMDNIEGS